MTSTFESSVALPVPLPPTGGTPVASAETTMIYPQALHPQQSMAVPTSIYPPTGPPHHRWGLMPFCRYGIKCRRKKTCKFRHPNPHYVNNTKCRDDRECKRRNCFFVHPNGRILDDQRVNQKGQGQAEHKQAHQPHAEVTQTESVSAENQENGAKDEEKEMQDELLVDYEEDDQPDAAMDTSAESGESKS